MGRPSTTLLTLPHRYNPPMIAPMKTSTVALILLLCGCGEATVETATLAILPDETSAEDQNEQSPLEKADTGMSWDHSEFGKTADGKAIEQYTLKNSAGTVVKLINYGATVVSVETVDRDGKLGNIALGHSSVEHWLKNACYFGCTAGRYANRIAKGIFGIEGNIYTLAKNDGDNHLHGGEGGFHKKLWEAEATSTEDSVTVTFHYISPDGDDRYPGTLTTTVQYTLNNDNELRIQYEASTDKATVVNLTNHTYWNLTGNAAKENVLEHQLSLRCNQYLPVDAQMIPTGDTLAVAETPFNFTSRKTIGSDLPGVEGGYDHCFIINRDIEGLVPAARVFEPKSGRVLEISTTEPGIQFYTGNFLAGKEETGGFGEHHGFCLETQHYPDSPNQPHFPTTILKPGEKYESTTVHKFSVYKG
jgi:aldose 1-epimerase